MAKEKHILTPAELEGFKSEHSEDEANLRALESGKFKGAPYSEAIDKNVLRKRIARYKKIVADHSPARMKGITKDKMAKKARELSERIKEGMPTSNEMEDLRKHPGAPHKNLQWERRNARNIQEYKQIMRRLEAGDPTASSIERLRR